MSDWESELDWERNINFDHITENKEYKEQYAFAVINNERGEIQRKQKKGWMLWDKGDDGYVDTFDPEGGKSAAKREDDPQSMYARVPVGRGKAGLPVDAYLMYMPLDMYQERVLGVHKKRADAQLQGVTVAAQEAAQAKGEGVDGVKGLEGQMNISMGPEFKDSDVNMGNS
jgi:hypothetical protein